MKITEHTINTIIENIDGMKRNDYIVGLNEIRADYDSNGSIGMMSPHFGLLSPNSIAMTQINQMIMPGLNQFAQQVISRKASDLYTNAFNRLVSSSDKTCMVRSLEDDNRTMRACLSHKYNRIDDDTVVGTIIDAIGERSEFQDKFKSIGGNVTETKTFVKFMSREPVFTIHADGRDRSFSAGIIFSNSETGHGTCNVQVLMVDRYCDNGCIFSSTGVGSFRLVHAGIDMSSKDKIGLIDRPYINNTKLETLRNGIKSILDSACNKDTFMKYQTIIQETAGYAIGSSDEAVRKWVDVIGREYDLTETERRAVETRLIETGDTTLFGVQAALTDAAKYVKTYDRKIELEQIGGNILVNLPSRWETIRKMVE